MMDFESQNTPAVPVLSAGTVLHDSYRINSTISADAQSIVYEAQDSTGQVLYIREYCPTGTAVRSGTTLSCNEDQETAFRNGGRQFVKLGKTLRRGVPHIVPVTDLFNENNTSYIVSDVPVGTPLSGLSASLTPAYVQNLGVMLCDTLAVLHAAGLYYRSVQDTDLCFSEEGELLLSALPVTTDGTAAGDVHALRMFLRTLLPDEESNDQSDTHLREALSVGCRDAGALKKALLGEKIKTKRRSGIPSLILCLVCLAAAIVGIQLLPETEKPLSEGVQSGSIRPEVIPVWLPLDENADENEVIAMYERLAAGFEQQNPGCGVDLRIYADDSFTEALSVLETSEEVPAVFMDTQDAVVQAYAADISSLTAALEDVYTADMTQFDTAVPLGCSVPVLFYNAHYTPSLQTMDADTILFDSLPANTVFDTSAADFVTAQDAAQKPSAQFRDFLLDGHYPVLASSSCIAQAEHSGISSGAVHMLPVAADGGISVQYEMYCTINRDASPNSQRVGMLWLRYLLTEEAQQILFAEHYGDLPLHKSVLPCTLEHHQALQCMGSALGVRPQTEEITTTQKGGQDNALEQ